MVHPASIIVVSGSVAWGVAGNVAQGTEMVAIPVEIIAVGQGSQGAFQWQNGQTVPGQVQITNNFWPQQADYIGEDRELEAREDFFGHSCPTDQMATLQHHYLFPGSS